MNKAICFKTLISIICVVFILNIFCLSEAYALGDAISSGKDFLSDGDDPNKVIDTTKLTNTSNTIYNALLAIAIVIAIIVSMVLGIQFMAASADEKAKVKEAILPFVIGCVVVFGSFTIWKVIVNIGNDAEGTVGGYSSAMDASIATSDITDGKIDIEDLSKEQIEDLYSNNRISSSLRDKMYGTAVMPKKEEDYLTLEQALNEIGSTSRAIYYKAVEYDLLEKDEKGNLIDLKQ